MEFTVGSIVTGKVTGITKFGAFVSLAPGKSGLVHISEIATSYVSDVNEFLKEGQEVKVKIIGIDDNGRINLSIKKAMAPTKAENRGEGSSSSISRGARPQQGRGTRPQYARDIPPVTAAQEKQDASFEDKLKQFMADSDSKISGLYADHRTSRRRRGN